MHHATNYFTKLYDEPSVDKKNENILLSSLEKVITDEDNIELMKIIAENEVTKIVHNLVYNKAPGGDGFPSEFYDKFWSTIKWDMVEIYNYMYSNTTLSISQKNGIVTIHYKGGDKCLLENWRPITLLCVDYKIFTRIIVARIKPLLCKIISDEQYCSVDGKTIIDCNIMLRDLLNFVIDRNMKFGMINIDFKQAFDCVDINFILSTMKALGFCQKFIEVIKMLYTGITSKLKINNLIGEKFKILKGVRQGCPLSMILFIIHQESLYRIIKRTNRISPILLPNNIELKLLGYADDTNVFICREVDLIALNEILDMYCEVTGAKINVRKTKIMGFGEWRNKITWPGNRYTPELSSLKCLGINYYNEWEETIKNNWLLIERKINTHIRCVSQRPLTIFQKSFYTNTVLLSKMLYMANIIPVNSEIVKRIVKCIFSFIWNGKYNPVKREILYLLKNKGGLGVHNIQHKCNSVLLKSFLKFYTKDHKFTKFTAYFCEFRLSAVLPKYVEEMDYASPPYYTYILNLCRNVMHLQSFPMITCKMIYNVLNPEYKSEIEDKYPLYRWNIIWVGD